MTTRTLPPVESLVNELGLELGRNAWAFLSTNVDTGELTVLSNLRPNEIRALVKAYLQNRTSEEVPKS